jgi:hypothetical protein
MKLPKSIRKFIRKEKARIRREIVEDEKQKEAIKKLYEEVISKLKKKKLPLKEEKKEEALLVKDLAKT